MQISNVGGPADMLIGYKQQGKCEADQKHLLPKKSLTKHITSQ